MMDNDQDAKQFFLNSMADVMPLDPKNNPRSVKPAVRQKIINPIKVHLEDGVYSSAGSVLSDTKLSFARPECSNAELEFLRRGKFELEATIDLHMCTAAEAQNRLIDFLEQAALEKLKYLSIIHGKGFHSHDDDKYPILKNKVNDWLRQVEFIRAFCSAQPQDGGTGAVYALMGAPLI